MRNSKENVIHVRENNSIIMLLRFNSASFFRALLVLFLGGFGLLSAAFGQTPTVTYLNIGLGYSAADTNTMPFAKYSVYTSGNYQFVAYYNTSQTVNIARRQLGSTSWNITTTSFVVDPSDDHRIISIAVDGNGLMHMSWGMLRSALNYTTSTASVLNNNPISFYSSQASSMPVSNIGGKAASLCYPQFYNVPGSGDLLFWYFAGESGNANMYLNRYNASAGTWSAVMAPVFDGLSSNQNAYLNTTVIDSQGHYKISWTWRETSDYQTNHDINFAQSTDGTTWTSITGAAINSGTSPVTVSSPNQAVVSIPQGSSLMNHTDMTDDLYGRPMIATYWAPGGSTNSTAVRNTSWCITTARTGKLHRSPIGPRNLKSRIIMQPTSAKWGDPWY